MSSVEAGAEGKRDDELRGAFERLVALAGGPTKSARALDVSRTTLDQWAKGRARIPLEPTLRLARLTGASLDELFGQARPEIRASRDGRAEGDGALPDGFVEVPMLQISASAGPGRIADGADLVAGGVAAFREDWLRSMGLMPSRTHVLTAVGDSMEPTIRNGDFLLVDRSVDRVLDNGIYVVVLAGLVLVKRIQVRVNGSLVLKSENPVYGEEIVPPDAVADVVIEGRVRWFGRGI